MFLGEKKQVGLYKHNFSPVIMTREFSSVAKDVVCKKRNIYEIDLFHHNKLDHQLFLQIFSQVFEK